MNSHNAVLFYISRKLRKVQGFSDCIRIIPKSAQGAFVEIVQIMRSRNLTAADVYIWNDISKEAEPNLRAMIFKQGLDSFNFVKPE